MWFEVYVCCGVEERGAFAGAYIGGMPTSANVKEQEYKEDSSKLIIYSECDAVFMMTSFTCADYM